jgi:DeoR/GlpR family transcriptional regulator of sugar metabolism
MSGAKTIAALATELDASEDTVRRTLDRLLEKGRVARFGDAKPYQWGLPAR